MSNQLSYKGQTGHMCQKGLLSQGSVYVKSLTLIRADLTMIQKSYMMDVWPGGWLGEWVVGFYQV